MLKVCRVETGLANECPCDPVSTHCHGLSWYPCLRSHNIITHIGTRSRTTVILWVQLKYEACTLPTKVRWLILVLLSIKSCRTSVLIGISISSIHSQSTHICTVVNSILMLSIWAINFAWNFTKSSFSHDAHLTFVHPSFIIPPNGGPETNKVLVRIGLIYSQSWLTNYLYKNCREAESLFLTL
jgi:hypothetical protein